MRWLPLSPMLLPGWVSTGGARALHQQCLLRRAQRHLVACVAPRTRSQETVVVASAAEPTTHCTSRPRAAWRSLQGHYHRELSTTASSSSEGTTRAPIGGTSQVRGSLEPPLLQTTIGQAFLDAQAKYPDELCLVSQHQNLRVTWSEFTQPLHVAVGLRRLGINTGDRVGIWGPNSWQWLATQYGTALAGHVLVNINPGYKPTELEYALNKVGCSALIMAKSVASNDFIDHINTLAPELAGLPVGKTGTLKSERLPHLKSVILIDDDDDDNGVALPGIMPFSKLLDPPPTPAELEMLEASRQQQDCHDVINIQFTSGTTGSPKGASLTHHSILNNGMLTAITLNYSVRDRICIPVPMYHCFGMVLGALAALTQGAAIVYPSAVFNPEKTLDAVEAEKCTSLYGVPTMFIAELNLPTFGKYNLSSLRTGIMAGSSCPEEVMRKVMTLMHMKEVTIGYGMTETSPLSFQSDVDDPMEKRVSTVGRVHSHCEVRIADPETNIPVPIGQAGEFQTRGYCVMKGYWNDDAKTAQDTCDDGFFKTGDMAEMDEQGYCRIVGRFKDVIIRGGENIFPAELEGFLLQHPKIQDAQVVGVPDEFYGEQVVACIIPSPSTTVTVEELRAYCEKDLAHFKIPRHFLFSESYPLTATGKVQKFVLRDWVREQLAQQAC